MGIIFTIPSLLEVINLSTLMQLRQNVAPCLGSQTKLKPHGGLELHKYTVEVNLWHAIILSLFSIITLHRLKLLHCLV